MTSHQRICGLKCEVRRLSPTEPISVTQLPGNTVLLHCLTKIGGWRKITPFQGGDATERYTPSPIGAADASAPPPRPQSVGVAELEATLSRMSVVLAWS